jgi:hypothetical protein
MNMVFSLRLLISYNLLENDPRPQAYHSRFGKMFHVDYISIDVRFLAWFDVRGSRVLSVKSVMCQPIQVQAVAQLN